MAITVTHYDPPEITTGVDETSNQEDMGEQVEQEHYATMHDIAVLQEEINALKQVLNKVVTQTLAKA